jgi:hypothetical protein
MLHFGSCYSAAAACRALPSSSHPGDRHSALFPGPARLDWERGQVIKKEYPELVPRMTMKTAVLSWSTRALERLD